jgi:hypothetical protein
VRNIFDQYEQPENRLTHALFATLDQDRSVLIPFLHWLGITETPKPRSLRITEQQVPGMLQLNDDVVEAKGLPDAAVFDDASWAVLFESKVQARVALGQVDRHRRTAKRHGFDSPWVVLISVDPMTPALPERTIAKQWHEIYSWFNCRSSKSIWVKQFVDYMQVYERKQLLQNYDIRGTITVFDGLRFDDDNPYTYREGKRLIRLLGDLLQNRSDLWRIEGNIGIDAEGERRPAITGRGSDGVWDFLPLTIARHAKQFTAYPHLTMGINRKGATAAVTIPNGVKGGIRKKLASMGTDGFLEIVANLEKRLRPVIKRSKGAKPMIYATQRHFRSQKSPGEVDARLEADLRTAIRSKQSGIRYQPQWIEAIYSTLVNKRSNIQFGVDVQFRYSCPIIQSRNCADLFADSWKALLPLVTLALDD